MNTYFGNYLGLCISNSDPEQRGRVQVLIPHIMPALYKNWNETEEDKFITCLGDNLPEALNAEQIERLRKILPWAEGAMPILGPCAPGRLLGSSYDLSPTASGGGQSAPFDWIEDPNANLTGNFPTNGFGIVNLPFVENAVIPGSTYGREASKPENIRPFQNVVLHYPDSPGNQQSFDFYTRYVQTYDADRGGTFGYSFIINTDGTIRQTAPLTARTNHIKADDRRFTNSNSLGIALMGDPDKNPDPRQIDALKRLLAASGIRNIAGHGDIQGNKGSELVALSARLRQELGSGGGGSLFGSGTDRAVDRFADQSSGYMAWARPRDSTPHEKQPSYLANGASGDPIGGATSAPTTGSSGTSTGGAPAKVVSTFLSNGAVTLNVDGYDKAAYLAVQKDGRNTYQPDVAPIGTAGKRGKVPSQYPGIVVPLGGPFKTGQLFNVVVRDKESGQTFRVNNVVAHDYGPAGAFREISYGLYADLKRQGANWNATPGSLSRSDKFEIQYEVLDKVLGSEADVEAYVNNSLDVESLLGDDVQLVQTGNPHFGNGNAPPGGRDVNDVVGGALGVPNPGAVLWCFFREGNPLFPVYFAASYGEKEWSSAYGQKGSQVPGSTHPSEDSPADSSGWNMNLAGGAGIYAQKDFNPDDPEQNRAQLMLYGEDGSHVWLGGKGYNEILSRGDHADIVEKNRFETVRMNKETWVNGINNMVIRGDNIKIVGNVCKEAIDAVEAIQKRIAEAYAPLINSGGGSGGGAAPSGSTGALTGGRPATAAERATVQAAGDRAAAAGATGVVAINTQTGKVEGRVA